MTTADYSTAAYPHSSHRRYVRGCAECLARTKAAQQRYTDSRRRNRQGQNALTKAIREAVQEAAAKLATAGEG